MAEYQRNRGRNCIAEHMQADIFFANWWELVRFLLHRVKELGTAGSQALANRVMKVLDMFWLFFKKKKILKIVRMKAVACRRLHHEQSDWNFGTLGLFILKYCFCFSFPKSCISFNIAHFPHNLGLIVEVFSIQSLISCTLQPRGQIKIVFHC